MTNKELIKSFFYEGYGNKNYNFVLEHVAKDYVDHSPAGARSNEDAVGILKCVSNMFEGMNVEIMDIFEENGMVATRVKYDAIHAGECMGIQATGRHITFEALENFKIENGKIVESWGYWPNKEIEQLLQL
ncbi:hypothetical protein lbkm_2637 [Lachnospiraceae bacterium KM106-2]|nr:hypothetical protein lbkm_2637 [Lachnospiraceae bacterium KM106-2]